MEFIFANHNSSCHSEGHEAKSGIYALSILLSRYSVRRSFDSALRAPLRMTDLLVTCTAKR